jgi:hypothetical protein
MGGLGPPNFFYIFEAPCRAAFQAFSKANLQTNNILTNNKNKIHFHSIISIYKILELYVNRLSFPCTVCEIVVGHNPWTIDLNNSTNICSQSDVSDYNSNIK